MNNYRQRYIKTYKQTIYINANIHKHTSLHHTKITGFITKAIICGVWLY